MNYLRIDKTNIFQIARKYYVRLNEALVQLLQLLQYKNEDGVQVNTDNQLLAQQILLELEYFAFL